MNLTKMKKKKGFTLIELMAVIAIIAILAAVLVPTVSGYITRSKKTAIITQVRYVVTAIETHNATAVGDNAIDLTKPLKSIVSNGSEDVKLEAGFATLDDIDRLAGMTCNVAIEINSDPDALQYIDVASNGVIQKYIGKTKTYTYSSSNGDESSKDTVGSDRK